MHPFPIAIDDTYPSISAISYHELFWSLCEHLTGCTVPVSLKMKMQSCEQSLQELIQISV